jgi:Terminase large subunit, T4likevirus-type, N-terminal
MGGRRIDAEQYVRGANGRDGPGTLLRGIRYKPLPTQRLFHLSAARFKGYSGPVGSGKSQALCQEAIRLAYQNPGRTGLVGAPTFPMLRGATQATLLEVMEENEIPFEWNKSENNLTFTDSGSRILLRAVEEYERLRGTNLAWFCVDELTYTAQEVWTRLEARLRDPKATRLCGFAAWTPRGFDWVYERFIANPVQGYEVFLSRPFENRYLLDQVPDYYERLKSSYDERFYQQEVLGEYLNLHAGQVYSSFDRTRNVETVAIDASQPIRWALDFNVDPMSSIVAQMVNGRVRVADEIVLRRATTLDACEEFLKRYGGHSAGVIVYGDASGQRMQTSGATDYQMVGDFMRRRRVQGFRMEVGSSNPLVAERVNLVNAKLRNADGEVALVMDPRCRELIKDFEQVSYKPDSSVVDKEKDSKRTHLSDALGYLIWQEMRPRAPAGGQPYRLF